MDCMTLTFSGRYRFGSQDLNLGAIHSCECSVLLTVCQKYSVQGRGVLDINYKVK